MLVTTFITLFYKLTKKLNKTLSSLNELLCINTFGKVNVGIRTSKRIEVSHFKRDEDEKKKKGGFIIYIY